MLFIVMSMHSRRRVAGLDQQVSALLVIGLSLKETVDLCAVIENRLSAQAQR
ncbi:hypothetical protein D3C87_1803890 [compost metagenome]